MFDFRQIGISLHFSSTSASSVWSTTVSVQIRSKTSCFRCYTHDQVIYGQIYNISVSNKTQSNQQSLFEPTSILSISLVSESTSISSRSRAEICWVVCRWESCQISLSELCYHMLCHIIQQLWCSKCHDQSKHLIKNCRIWFKGQDYDVREECEETSGT